MSILFHKSPLEPFDYPNILRPLYPLSSFTREEDGALEFDRTFVKVFFSQIWAEIRWQITEMAM